MVLQSMLLQTSNWLLEVRGPSGFYPSVLVESVLYLGLTSCSSGTIDIAFIAIRSDVSGVDGAAEHA